MFFICMMWRNGERFQQAQPANDIAAVRRYRSKASLQRPELFSLVCFIASLYLWVYYGVVEGIQVQFLTH